jgi:hypothetical protein
MVLRQRDIETIDRHRRSPSPVRVREERLIRRPRSVSPHYDHERERERTRTKVVERESVRRSPSPRPVRFVERRRSPSPAERERIRARIIDRERSSSSSSSEAVSEPAKVIRGPTIEREVITHYRDIDHGTYLIIERKNEISVLTGIGVIRARQPSPPPRPRSRVRERETDIDIQLSKNRTEVDVDIKRSSSRARSRSRERRRPTFEDGLSVDYVSSRRRARSAAPLRSPDIEEANYITGKIDSRGRIGEAYHGATKDWAIVDVPPGTERIRMDGVGGASTDTTFSKYSGVRRTKFIPEGQDAIEPRKPSPTREKDRTSVTVYDREREVDIERTVERRTPRPAKSKDMWTEISKDLVSREAIEYMGYEYEDTPMFFYIMDYLRYVSLLTLLRGGNYVADLERRTMCST